MGGLSHESMVDGAGVRERKYLAPLVHVGELVAEFAVVGVEQLVVLRTHLREGCNGASQDLAQPS